LVTFGVVLPVLAFYILKTNQLIQNALESSLFVYLDFKKFYNYFGKLLSNSLYNLWKSFFDLKIIRNLKITETQGKLN